MIPPIHSKYWMYIGSSIPKYAAMSSRLMSVDCNSAYIRSMMSPGISRTVMKTMIVMMISVGKASSSRLTMYLVIANCGVGSM